jgi:hypothetical protein
LVDLDSDDEPAEVLFATLDALRQGVELPPNRIEQTLAMLMLIREYVVPLASPSRRRAGARGLRIRARLTLGA